MLRHFRQNVVFSPIYIVYISRGNIDALYNCSKLEKGFDVVPPNIPALFNATNNGSPARLSWLVSPPGLYISIRESAIISPAGKSYSKLCTPATRNTLSNVLAKYRASVFFCTTTLIADISPRMASIIAVFCSSVICRSARFCISSSNSKRNRLATTSRLAALSFALAASAFALAATDLASAPRAEASAIRAFASASSRFKYPSRTFAIHTAPIVATTVSARPTISAILDAEKSQSAVWSDGHIGLPAWIPLSAISVVIVAAIVGVVALVVNYRRRE